VLLQRGGISIIQPTLFIIEQPVIVGFHLELVRCLGNTKTTIPTSLQHREIFVQESIS